MPHRLRKSEGELLLYHNVIFVKALAQDDS